MKKGLITIIIGVLTVVSLILALPVSPLRYSSQGVINTYVEGVFSKIGVDINGKMITARQITRSGQYDAFGLDLNKSDGKRKIGLSGNYSNLNNNLNNNYVGSLDLKISNSMASGMGADAGFSSSKSGKSSNANASVQKVGFRSMSDNVVSTGNETATRQNATTKNYSTNQGGTHPGLDPDVQLGNLPIGDGTALMIIFSFFFGFFKIRKL